MKPNGGVEVDWCVPLAWFLVGQQTTAQLTLAGPHHFYEALGHVRAQTIFFSSDPIVIEKDYLFRHTTTSSFHGTPNYMNELELLETDGKDIIHVHHYMVSFSILLTKGVRTIVGRIDCNALGRGLVLVRNT